MMSIPGKKTLATFHGFHECLPKLQLKTFASIKKLPKKRLTNKETMLKADNRLFGHMVLVANSRNLHMRQVLQHPLGPLPWSQGKF